MPIRQITIVGTGLIGGSLGLALRKARFRGRIVGCDRPIVLERAKDRGAIDVGEANPARAVRNSDVIVLATPVSAIVELIERLGPVLPPKTLLTDVGSTKTQVLARAIKIFGRNAGKRFLAGHPMAGKEQSGVEYADADLFRGAGWFFTPAPDQDIFVGMPGDFLEWVTAIGARTASMEADAHDQLCAWISHLPQMISTALAAALVEEFGEDAPLLEAGGRALREMTRISASPYSMWRDIAITNKDHLRKAIWQIEQRLAHIRENLDTKELAMEFEQAHHLRKPAAKAPPKPRLPRK